MEKVGIFVIVICLCCIISTGIKSKKRTNDSNLKIERDNGYKKGYVNGQIKAEEDFSKILEKNKKEYEAKLESDRTVLEKKILDSYNEGLQNGIDKMTEEINSAIKINTEEKQNLQKQKKQNWNDIISKVGE